MALKTGERRGRGIFVASSGANYSAKTCDCEPGHHSALNFLVAMHDRTWP